MNQALLPVLFGYLFSYLLARYKVRSGIRVIRSTRLTFEDYSDLISISWNVEDDILLRGEVCDTRKKKKRTFLLNSEDPAKKSGQFLAGFLVGLEGVLEKNWISPLPRIQPEIRLEIRPDLGRIVTWHLGSQL